LAIISKSKIIEGGNDPKIGIEAPKNIPIQRQSIFERENGLMPDKLLHTVEDL
jgi:hypothetical protein